MHRSLQQRHPASRPHAIAYPVVSPSSELYLTVAYLLASVIMALWLAYLPKLGVSILTNVNVVPQHLTDDLIDRLHKADRLGTATFMQRWNGRAPTAAPPSPAFEPIRDGCEPAFSRLAAGSNFSGRCIVKFAAPTRFAATE